MHVKLRTKKHIMHAFMMSSSFDIINFLNRQQTLAVFFHSVPGALAYLSVSTITDFDLPNQVLAQQKNVVDTNLL